MLVIDAIVRLPRGDFAVVKQLNNGCAANHVKNRAIHSQMDATR